jgi:predicted AAA+ superfamily ATPase
MYIKRKIDTELLEWMSSPERKPLLIRGARQVGKSTAVRELAKHFTNYIEVNFDESSTFNQLFSNGLGVDDLLDELALITRTEISD